MRSRPHTSKSPLFAAAADALVPFLARRFRDSAIVGPDLREMMLQTVSLLLQTKAFVAKFEESHDARAHLVSSSLLLFVVPTQKLLCPMPDIPWTVPASRRPARAHACKLLEMIGSPGGVPTRSDRSICLASPCPCREGLM